MKQSNQPPERRDNDGIHRRRGVWYFALSISGTRRFFSTKTTNYLEARRIRAAAVKTQLENRLPNDAAKMRFETLLAGVLEDRKPSLAENSIRIDKERSIPLLRYFAGRRVCEIDAKAIRDYQNARSKQVSTRTVNLETKVLRCVLRSAGTWGTLSDDFKPLKEDRHGPGRALEESQERLLFDTAASRPEWDVAFLAGLASANTTMRGCELKSLRLQDVNLPEREVTIRRSKTDTGIRRIPLNSAALWAFARLLERAGALGSVKPEHFLFPRCLYRQTKTADRGAGYDANRPQKTWRTSWRALTKQTARRAGREAARGALEARLGLRAAIAAWRRAAGPFRGLRFHDLRHLAITKLAESDASDSTVMSIAGHLNRGMMELYSHVRAAAKRKAVDSIRSWRPEEEPAVSKETVQ